MTTVIDQASPWFTPRSTLAATTQVQLGAKAISSGTGSAKVQPTISSRRRPKRSAPTPAARFVTDLASPKAVSPIRGSVERSKPTIAPTNTLMATSRENCARLSRSPSRTWVMSGLFDQRTTAAVGGDDLGLLRRRRGQIDDQGLDESLLRFELQRPVVAPLEADRGGRLGGEPAAANRPRVVRGVEQEVIGKPEQSLVQRVVELSGHLLRCLLAVGVEVGASGVPHEQSIAGQDHPRLRAAGQIGDEIGVMDGGMAGCGDGLDDGVAELDDLPVAEGDMVEADSRVGGEVGRRARALDQPGQAGDVVGLDVRLKDGDDRDLLPLGQLDVVVDKVGMGIDDREPLLRLAAEEVGRAGRLVVEELSEVHALTSRIAGAGSFGALTIYQLIY